MPPTFNPSTLNYQDSPKLADARQQLATLRGRQPALDVEYEKATHKREEAQREAVYFQASALHKLFGQADKKAAEAQAALAACDEKAARARHAREMNAAAVAVLERDLPVIEAEARAAAITTANDGLLALLTALVNGTVRQMPATLAELKAWRSAIGRHLGAGHRGPGSFVVGVSEPITEDVGSFTRVVGERIISDPVPGMAEALLASGFAAVTFGSPNRGVSRLLEYADAAGVKVK
jgi:hypothetical protein